MTYPTWQTSFLAFCPTSEYNLDVSLTCAERREEERQENVPKPSKISRCHVERLGAILRTGVAGVDETRYGLVLDHLWRRYARVKL